MLFDQQTNNGKPNFWRLVGGWKTLLQFFKGSTYCQHDESNQQENVIILCQNFYTGVVADNAKNTTGKANDPGYFFGG